MPRKLTLKQAINRFRKHLLVQLGYSELTAKAYTTDLKLLKQYLQEEFNLDDEESVFIEDIGQFELKGFLDDDVLIADNKTVTRNRKLYSLKTFYSFLTEERIVEDNPTKFIKAAKTESGRKPIYLSAEEMNQYLKTIRNSDSRNQIRDLAIIAVLLYAGARASELVNLDVEDINYNEQLIELYGKNKKIREVPINNKIIGILDNYLAVRAEKYKPKSEDTDALFLSMRGNRISQRTIRHLVKKYAKESGVKNASKISPHKLRHTFASLLYRETKSLRVVQQLLGHENISTTQIYTHVDREQQREAVDQLPDINL